MGETLPRNDSGGGSRKNRLVATIRQHLPTLSPLFSSEKFWNFAESPFTWGAIGMVAGAIGTALSLAWLFMLSGILLAIAILKQNFFEGKSTIVRIMGTLTLLAIMTVSLAAIYRYAPTPKEPPTVEEIADAVIKKQREEIRVSQTTPPTIGQAPTEVERPPPKPKPSPSKPAPQPPPQQQQPPIPPEQARLTISQKPQVSSRADAPYKTEVVVQTTIEFPKLKLVIQCDKPLVDGSVGIGSGGVLMMTSQGVLRDHPNVFIFTYQSATPPLGPANPVTANLWSKEPIKCEAATF